MSAPVMAYVVGILCALPIFGLVAALAYMALKLFVQWLIEGGSDPALSAGRTPKRFKATLKG